MKIALASDHAGFSYKEAIGELLRRRGHDVQDFGTTSTAAVDYPDFIRPAAESVASGRCEVGVILGGSGNGEAIVANRLKGIRCAVCWNIESARLAKSHNNANIISIGERMMTLHVAETIVETWLDTSFDEGRHRRRINKIDMLDTHGEPS